MAVEDNVGDIYVDVGADTTTLEAQLKAKLDALSKKLKAKIQATIDSKAAQASLAALRTAAQKTINIPVQVSKDSIANVADFGFLAKKELNAAIGTIKILTSAQGIDFVKAQIKTIPGVAKSVVADIRTSISTSLASGQLGTWVKEQSLKTVHIGVDVSKAALAKASAQLQSFTGLNAVRGEFEKFSMGLQEFFNDLPGVAKTVLKLSSFVSLIGTALGSALVTINLLGSAIPGLGAAALALPGILAAGAAEAAVLVVAIKDAPPAVRAAVSAYKQLGKEIGTNFWAGAKTNVVDFFNTVKGATKDGLNTLSATMGQFTGSFAASLQTSLGGGVLQGIFANINAGFAALAPAAAPFANILATLGTYGTSLLPAISGWLSRIAATFDAWLSNAVATGKLTGDLQALGSVLQIIWNAGGAIIGIFKGLGTAASNAGIGDLLSPLQMIANVVNSPTFQLALTTLFQGMAAGAQGLLSALVPIGNMIASLAPTISGFLAAAGSTLGSLFSTLAKALSSPVFQTGLTDFFNGILDFVKPLIPLMPIFAEKLALIGSFAGKLLQTLGPVFASLLAALVPVLDQIFKAVGPIVTALGPVLSGVFKALGPILIATVKAASPFLKLVSDLLPLLLPVIDSLAKALAPALESLAPLFTQLIDAVMPIITDVLAILTPLLGPIIGIFIQLVEIALKPFIVVLQILAPILNALTPVLTLIAQIVGAVLTTAVDLLTGKFSDIGKVWSGVWNDIIGFYNTTVKPLWSGFSDFIIGIWTGVANFVGGIWKSIAKGIVDFGAGVTTIWNGIWNGVSKTFTDIWNGIAGFQKGIFNGILGGVQGFINGTIDAINGLTGAINGVSGVIGIPKIGKLPHVSLPRLADGATILPRPGGTAAVLGEGGRSESVVDTGLMNRLLELALSTLPKAVSALSGRIAQATGQAATSNSSTTHNWDVDLTMPDYDDPKAAAQEVVNRLAEKVA